MDKSSEKTKIFNKFCLELFELFKNFYFNAIFLVPKSSRKIAFLISFTFYFFVNQLTVYLRGIESKTRILILQI